MVFFVYTYKIFLAEMERDCEKKVVNLRPARREPSWQSEREYSRNVDADAGTRLRYRGCTRPCTRVNHFRCPGRFDTFATRACEITAK